MSVGFDTSAFTEEAYELLSELEDSLLVLEEEPGNQEVIGRVFRAMHTIKGSGAMFGFEDVAAFTHEVETVFDMVRNGVLPVTQPLIDLTLAARDHIRALLDASKSGAAVDTDNANAIIAGLQQLVADNKGAPAAAAQAPVHVEAVTPVKALETDQQTYRVSFRPKPNIFATGTNPILLLHELRDIGPCQIIAGTDDLPDLKDLDPESCYLFWDIFLTTDKGDNVIRDVFIFVEDECDLKITPLAEGETLSGDGVKKLGQILVERGDIRADDLERVLHNQMPLGERLVAAGVVSPTKVQAALLEQKIVKEKQESKQQGESTTSVRVPAERLDSLVDLVGELVTVQARLTQTSLSLQHHDLLLIAEEVERLTSELRDNTMSIRMLPIGTTFNKFKRLVRDLSRDLGKPVEMTTSGGDTELDKTVIDQLNDPLVHIIRNSMDHGIEPPEIRREAGKPETGRVHLSAEHSGASVLIKVTDDGKGLDPAKLRAKGIERGLITPDADLPDRELFGLIFQAGFSMAKEITNLSGRGVGMDVVKRSIDALRGSIEVQSKAGQGTTITLKLPLTLAIIEGLLVKIEDEHFVLPLAAVEECVELTRAEAAKSHGRNVINVRGDLVPYIRMRDRFIIEGVTPEVEQIVITQIDEHRVGFVVDHVIGQHQTVIKSLGKHFSHSEEFSGATILGDGTVALILDMAKMFHLVEREETENLMN